MAEDSSTSMASKPWRALTDSDNLTSLSELNQKTLLEAMKKRFMQDRIYTDVGDILVAINPFSQLPCYSADWLNAFHTEDLSGFVPHIYKVGARAYNSMIQGKKDQVCVISGESGAGKTESSKLIMKQIMHMCKTSAGVGPSLQHKITQLNPILEAFGNAKTVLNNNSSRFGKFLQLVFQSDGRVIGAGLEQYLLEKSRVCVQGDGERNFHIFYYLYAGLDKSKLKKLLLKDPVAHSYLNNCPSVMEECMSEFNRAEFGRVASSMKDIGFDEEELEEVYVVLAAIILLGDIEFQGSDGSQDNATVKNPESTDLVAELLGLEDGKDLCFALVTLRTETRGESVDKRYKCSKAADVRDGLAKALYSRLFRWIVNRLNNYLQPYPTSNQLNIGILDIFGFENFESNSFEQFCINLANEQLQCYFNHQIFAMEQMELKKEGLSNLGDLSYKDNQPVLDLFLTKPIGLMSLLDEQCRGLNGTDKAFVQRCKDSFKKHGSYVPDKGSSLQFTIRHYAGSVLYKVPGFVEKNKDSLPDMLVEAVRYGKVKLMSTLFRRSANPSSELKKSVLRKSQRHLMRAMSRRKSMRNKGRGKPQKVLTVSGHFQQSLKELMERIFAASPHFVRCIKPNYQKLPRLCDDEFMLKQLTYTGMLEAVRVRREGFAFRPFFSDFFKCYHSIAFHYTDPEVRSSEASCQVILEKAGLTGWQMGKSRVFLRYFHEERLNLLLRDQEKKVTLIQKIYRGYIARKYTTPMREKQKLQKEMATEFFSLLTKNGRAYVDTLISLNKKDILLAKERFGQRRKKPAQALSSHPSFMELTEQEKKVRKAQQFGVRLVPDLKVDSRKENKILDKDDSQNSSEDAEPGHSDVAMEILPSPDHTPPITPTPIPRARRKNKYDGKERLSTPVPVPRSSRSLNRSTTKLNVEWRPVPVKRMRRRHTSDVTGNEEESQLLLSSPIPIPRPRSRIRNSLEVDSVGLDRPVPKPRRRSTNVSASDSSLRETPRSSLEMSAVQVELSDDHFQKRYSDGSRDRELLEAISDNDFISVPAYILDAGSTESIDNILNNGDPTLSNQDNHTQSPTHAGESCSEVARPSLAYNSSASQPTEIPGKLPGKLDSVEGTSRAKARPRSMVVVTTLEEKEEPNGIRGERSQTVGAWYRNNGSQGPPMADKRKTKKKWRLSGGSNNSDSTLSWAGQVLEDMGPAASLLELVERDSSSDVDLLGFYPNFSRDRAMEYVLGQPKGTYVIYQDKERLNGSRLPRYVLLVSAGRPGVCGYHILAQSTNKNLHGLFFHLATETSGHAERRETTIVKKFHYLKTLVEHYRSHEIESGLKLCQPRLLAGVPVVRSTRLQPLLHRKQLVARN